MIFGVVLNLFLMYCYFWGIRELADDNCAKEYGILWPTSHKILKWSSVVFFALLFPNYVLAIMLDPGSIKKKYEYISLVDKALECQLNLDNFCSYCEVMKTVSSFHCTTCNRCVEMFDHHCPFINNCLGYRNHRFFLFFIFFYALFLFSVTLETLRHFAEVFIHIGISCFATDRWTTFLLILVSLHTPVIIY
jgi:hypothetical protein